MLCLRYKRIKDKEKRPLTPSEKAATYRFWLGVPTLSLVYGLMMAMGTSFDWGWVKDWIELVDPAFRDISPYLLGTEPRVQEIVDFGYAHKENTVRHLYVTSMIWGMLFCIDALIVNVIPGVYYRRIVREFGPLKAFLVGVWGPPLMTVTIYFMNVVRHVVETPSAPTPAEWMHGYAGGGEYFFEYLMYFFMYGFWFSSPIGLFLFWHSGTRRLRCLLAVCCTKLRRRLFL